MRRYVLEYRSLLATVTCMICIWLSLSMWYLTGGGPRQDGWCCKDTLPGMDLDRIERMATATTPRVLPIVIHPIVNVDPKKVYVMDRQ